MLYIILIFILVILSIFIISFKNEQLSKKNKIIMSILIFILVVGIVVYQITFDRQSQKNKELLVLFNQGNTLACKGVDVNKKDFNYFGGTSTFLANNNNESLRGVQVLITDCEIK